MKDRTLIIGYIPKNYSSSRHIIISPHCFLENDIDAFEIYDCIEGDAFDSPYEIKYAEKRCNELAGKIFTDLYKQLNYINDLSYGPKFWKIVLYPWLLYATQMIYERKLRIEKLIKKYGGYSINVEVINNNYAWKIFDTDDFIGNVMQNVEFNEWLYSRLIEKMKPSLWDINKVERSRDIIRVRGKADKCIKLKLKQLKDHIFPSRVKNIYGFISVDYILFGTIISCTNKNISNNINSDINNLWVSENGSNISRDEVETYNDIIGRIIPQSIINIRNRINKLKQTHREGKLNLVSAMVVTNNDKEKLKYALRYELGEKLIITQHGGHNYGTSMINSVPNIVEYQDHMFLSWGWEHQEDYSGKIVPIASPYLSKFIWKYKNKSDDIIFVGNRMTYFLESFDGTPQPKQSLQYRENKIIFLSTLSKHAFKNIVYRPYFKKSITLSDREYIEKKFPQIRIFDSVKNNEFSFHKKLLRSNMLVLDHPGTTFIIAIVANIPFVCFWDKNFFPFSKQSEWILCELGKEGVYWDSPIGAARQVNLVAQYAQDWWSQATIQNVRKNIIQEQGLNNKNWRLEWLRFFWKNFIKGD